MVGVPLAENTDVAVNRDSPLAALSSVLSWS